MKEELKEKLLNYRKLSIAERISLCEKLKIIKSINNFTFKIRPIQGLYLTSCCLLGEGEEDFQVLPHDCIRFGNKIYQERRHSLSLLLLENYLNNNPNILNTAQDENRLYIIVSYKNEFEYSTGESKYSESAADAITIFMPIANIYELYDNKEHGMPLLREMLDEEKL